MLAVFLWCWLCVYCFGLREVPLPPYTPLSREEITDKYFQNSTSDGYARLLNYTNSDLLRNISHLRSENVTHPFKSIIRELLTSHESTTFKYPSATWTAMHHEKLKEEYQNRTKLLYLFKPSPFLKPPFIEENDVSSIDDDVQISRGTITWTKARTRPLPPEDSSSASSEHRETTTMKGEDAYADRFLEHSLMKYLASSNLKEKLGDVSVNTFSALLNNVTQAKSNKTKHVAPYDKNKELRIKFREEVLLKKKFENKHTAGILERQLQKRLEKMQEMNEKVVRNLTTSVDGPEFQTQETITESFTETSTEDVTSSTEVYTENQTDPNVIVTTIIPEAITEMVETTTQVPVTTTTTKKPSRNKRRRVVRRKKIKSISGNEIIENKKRSDEDKELKLSVAETVYYRKRYSPYLATSSLLPQGAEDSNVIPGVAHVDYPMYSTPPDTGFKCPSLKGDRPHMMADRASRCQVFYICTGDGPASPMLCPNGTMFNENFLVCDWWYNVKC